MKKRIDRREFLKLAGIGSFVLVSGLESFAFAAGKDTDRSDFFFVQMSALTGDSKAPKSIPTQKSP